MKKKLRRIFLYCALTIGLLVTVPLVAVVVFKDDIIDHFIREANKRIDTPVRVKKISLSVWRNFPNISIVFHDVYVEDSYAGEQPLLTAKSILFYVDLKRLWQGQYSILGLRVNKGEINLKVNKRGVNNYTVLKDIKDSEEFIDFDLRNIRLNNTTISYSNKQKKQRHRLSTKKMRASIIASKWYEIKAQGTIVAEQINIQSVSLLNGKTFDVKVALRYNRESGNMVIEPSTIALQRSQFEVQGRYDSNSIDISCNGKNTTIQTLLSLFPEKVNTYTAAYKSDGDVYFKLAVKGRKDAGHQPVLSIRFGLKNMTLLHADYPSKIKNVNLKGAFTLPSMSNLSKASLTLKDIAGTLNGKHFEGGISIQNFIDPYVQCNIKGDIDVAPIANFYTTERWSDINGSIHADIDFAGSIGSLKNKAIDSIVARGMLKMQNLGFVYEKKSQMKDLNGILRFTNNDLKVDSMMGEYMNTDFHIHGILKNVFSFFFKQQPIGIEVDFKSDFIDMDQMLGAMIKTDTSSQPTLVLPKNVYLNLNCTVGKLHYKRFKPSLLTGNLLVKNQIYIMRNAAFRTMGGDVAFNAVCDAQKDSVIDIMGTFKLKKIQLDSAFYVFDNFKQKFIRHEHLKGNINADIDLEMTLNKALILLPKTLIANVNTVIKKGELNNFTPLQKLNKYIPEQKLNQLQFFDIKNNILIENRTIYIPSMKLKSNAATITISGVHGFNQQIDYHLSVPLKAQKKADKDEAFGEIEEDVREKTKLFLRISGTTKNYKITYDKEAVKQKIADDIKKEVNELQEVFRRKGKQKKSIIKVQKDDYFNWDDTVRINDR